MWWAASYLCMNTSAWFSTVMRFGPGSLLTPLHVTIPDIFHRQAAIPNTSRASFPSTH